MKSYSLLFCLLLVFSACSQAQPDRQQATIAMLQNILQHFSSHSPKALLPLLQIPGRELVVHTEIFDKSSNGYAVGIDSIQHYTLGNAPEDFIKITYFNDRYNGQTGLKEVLWTTRSRYSRKGNIISFDSSSRYPITLWDLQQNLGRYQKELIPRKGSNLCTFSYYDPATFVKATIDVDCFLPCDAPEGNTLNFIRIMLQG